MSVADRLPAIALIGRPNVGKSTLFNRLTETDRAITDRLAGTTRDRTDAIGTWRGQPFRLIDTGGGNFATMQASLRERDGKPPRAGEPLETAIQRQTLAAIREADVLAVVVDGSLGLLPADRQLAQLVRPMTTRPDPGWGGAKRVVLVCNKIDRTADEGKVAEFFALGLGPPYPVSAKSGRSSGDLLEALHAALAPRGVAEQPPPAALRIGLVGKPNVGKSSLLNRLVGVERVIVSPEPLTTRETQEAALTYRDFALTLVDTAGIKSWTKISGRVATAATRQSLAALAQLDLALLVVDASQPIHQQDRALARMVSKHLAGAVIVANKWDLVQPSEQPIGRDVAAHFHHQLQALAWAPVITVSAVTGQNVAKILDWCLDIWQRRQTRIDRDTLQRFLQSAARAHRPTGLGVGQPGQAGGRRPRLVQLEQTGINPPSFTLWLPPRQSLTPTYRRFLEHRLLATFTLQGVNAKLYVKQLRQPDRRSR